MFLPVDKASSAKADWCLWNSLPEPRRFTKVKTELQDPSQFDTLAEKIQALNAITSFTELRVSLNLGLSISQQKETLFNPD